MVLKLPRDLLQFVDENCNGESYQTFIIKLLREKQQSYTQHKGITNGKEEKREYQART